MLRLFASVSLIALCAGAGVLRGSYSKPKSNKIVGGIPVNIQDVPYQIALYKRGSFSCGGVIISESVALTAGHCTHGAQAKNVVLYGGFTRLSDQWQASKHQATKLLTHPKYNDNSLDYDVGLIWVEQPFVFDFVMQPIGLASSEPAAGALITVTGWGTVTATGDLSENLLKTVIPIVDRNVCLQDYVDDFGEDAVTERMICAGTPGHDHCFGDSGGPLTYNNTLVGTVSWAKGCGDEGYPGVSANTANPEINSWIKENAQIQ